MKDFEERLFIDSMKEIKFFQQLQGANILLSKLQM